MITRIYNKDNKDIYIYIYIFIYIIHVYVHTIYIEIVIQSTLL